MPDESNVENIHLRSFNRIYLVRESKQQKMKLYYHNMFNVKICISYIK